MELASLVQKVSRLEAEKEAVLSSVGEELDKACRSLARNAEDKLQVTSTPLKSFPVLSHFLVCYSSFSFLFHSLFLNFSSSSLSFLISVVAKQATHYLLSCVCI